MDKLATGAMLVPWRTHIVLLQLRPGSFACRFRNNAVICNKADTRRRRPGDSFASFPV